MGSLMSGLKGVVKPAVRAVFPPPPELSYEDIFRKIRRWNSLQSTPSYSFNNYQMFINILRKWGAASPKSVLELGPGAHLGVLYCFLVGGAERAAGLDISPTVKDPEFYRLLNEYLKHFSGLRWWRPPTFGDVYQYPEHSWDRVDVQALVEKIEYHQPFKANETPFADDDFDLIYSNSAMEHFDQPRETVREIYRVLKPGGVTVHGIDLRSHVPGDDLGHLKFSEEEYLRQVQKYDPNHGITKKLGRQWKTQVYCNRVLAKEWQSMFEDQGFEVLETILLAKLRLSSINPAEFAAPFSNKTPEELAPLVMSIVARKPS